MKKWIQKAIVQKTISYLPFKHKINYLFQKHVTRGVNLTDAYFYDRLLHAKEHLKGYSKYASSHPEICLEIGTGWYPIVPVCFFLAGASRIYSVDIVLLTSKKRLASTLRRIINCHYDDVLQEYINYDVNRLIVLESVLDQIERVSLDQSLKSLHIHYLIEDAGNLSLEDNSVDLINSNNTFEHIAEDNLSDILKDFRRVVKKPGGIMSHFIDMSDHFAHFDQSISIYNFLKFSDRQWKWIDNSIQPQNRLRIYHYRDLFSKIDIPVTEVQVRKGDPQKLKLIPVDSRYCAFPEEETAISHCYFISCFDK
jgi:hypothetical protein